MEHKSDNNDSTSRSSGDWDDDHDGQKEFNDAVTSELSGIHVTAIKVMPATDGSADPELNSEPLQQEGGSTRAGESLPVDDPPLEPGFVLAERFEIVALVHSGGMGHVYKAIDMRRHRAASGQVHVAIKMMRRSIASIQEARDALEREAAKTQHLAHPNIVNIFDFDQHDDQFYLVMEWLEGETVNALLRRTSGQRLETQFAWRIVEGIASGLQHAHSHNVVHADINPSNIFITETQEIKLLDFGVARYTSDPDYKAGEKSIWVTQTYASPEVLSGITPTFEDDIFSLACVAYRLLSGTHPFAGRPSVDSMQAGTEVPRIAGLSDEYWHTLSAALSYDRVRRPNSASVFLAPSPADSEPGLLGRLLGARPRQHWLLLAGVAASVLAAAWWLTPLSTDTQSSPEPAGVVANPEPAADEARTAGVAELLSRAAIAVDEQRLIAEPGGDDALSLYLEVLASEPQNPIAAGGLRAISDTFVQQANTALGDGNPQQAADALALAREADPTNPSIGIVDELLSTQAASQLAMAQLAAAEGDNDNALALLADAQRFPGIDASVVDSVRSEIAESLADQQFLAELTVADAHIDAGRLLTPAGNNARSSLATLKVDHPDDARLLASMNRLGERLLARAGFATATRNYSEARTLLDAAGTLGVLSKEVEAARLSLQRARAQSRAAAAASKPSEAQKSDADTPVSTVRTAASGQANVTGNEPATAQLPTVVDATTSQSPTVIANAAARTTGQSSAAAAAPPERKITSLTDLGIEKYVAPRYPRSARRRGVNGFVEVRFTIGTDGSTSDIRSMRSEPGKLFASSAERAVTQWRFAPREDVITTQITLSFALEP